MKRKWIGPLIIGLVLGISLGVVFSPWVNRPRMPEGSAFFREFSFTEFAAGIEQTNWQVLEDRIYESFPSLARSQRIARRIVAHADLSESELGRFTSQFQQAAAASLSKHGAIIKGQFDLESYTTQIGDASASHSLIDLPRRYYAIGEIHGVADIWYVAESGRVTVMVSLIEGL